MSSAATKLSFPMNAWYAAAYDVELRRALLPRTVCNKKLVMYRRADGTPAVLEDACWHRLLPLSKGRLIGDEVECGYHGLVYSPEGRCISMPSQEKLNPSACVRSFPVAEKHRFIWVWLGDSALADVSAIPDLHWNNDPAWAGDGKLLHVNCDYRLVVDNLMDLTHETFVHNTSLGNRAVAEAPFTTTHSDTSATVTRWMRDIEPPPFWAEQLRQPGKVDRWQIINFQPPCTVTIDVGVAPAGSGAPEGDRSRGVNGYVLNTITPESETSCHYFWAFCRNYRLSEQGVTQSLREGVSRVFAEDEVILEAQQQALLDHPDKSFRNLNIDAGAVWARRIIDRLVAAEQDALRPATAGATQLSEETV
ncbi:MAG: aromatic ring-hydroxylating dioxygenase subunit alpha [Proteobacteria bacterium]|nr:aromatic ring-hydroxylating dioxygenase subunit alpha [Pseudomonadota bacterium]